MTTNDKLINVRRTDKMGVSAKTQIVYRLVETDECYFCFGAGATVTNFMEYLINEWILHLLRNSIEVCGDNQSFGRLF